VAFNGFNISGPVADSPIVAALINSNSTVTGLTNATVIFAADSVTVNLAGDPFSAGSIGLIDVRFGVPLACALVVVSWNARLNRFHSVQVR
jgi:hypothetical protein